MSEKEKESIRREECRLACMAYLYDRASLAMGQKNVFIGVNADGYDFDEDEIEVALQFLADQGWVKIQTSAMGSKKFAQITAAGQLQHERC